MRKISVCSQKGGVGKTAVAVNLAADLARMSRSTLLVDLAPQADATSHLGMDREKLNGSVHDLLTDKTDDISSIITPTRIRNLSIIPSDILKMTAVEMELAVTLGREAVLAEKISGLKEEYDFIIFDCPPGSGILTINALMASTEWIMPVQAHFLALSALDQLFLTTLSLEHKLDHRTSLTGVICTLFDSRTRLSKEIENELRRLFGSLVYSETMKYHTSVGEAPTFGLTIGEYEAGKAADRNFQELAIETVKRNPAKKKKGESWYINETAISIADDKLNGDKGKIRQAGGRLRETLSAVMADLSILEKMPAYHTLSSSEEIKAFNYDKKSSIGSQESEELWK